MLLRHPDVQFYEIDRVAFGLVLVSAIVGTIVKRRALFTVERATWPMIGLSALAVASALGQSFDHETWSLLASKFVVPFVLFHLAGRIFVDEKTFRQFEIFALIVLAYLSFTAIAFLCRMHFLIFPRFILDESLGFHADRARGPLLQAVANGVSINLLGLLAFHAIQRGTLRGAKAWLLLSSLPFAILATMTRAVWVSFAASVVWSAALTKSHRLRRVFFVLAVAGVVGLIVLLNVDHYASQLGERLEERGPIDYRAAVYQGGWEMFLQRPWFGWGIHQMPAELPRHVSGYHERVLYPHNTYLELVVEHGIVGLTLYVWLMWELLRLGKGWSPSSENVGFLNRQFHRMWPVILAVYWTNAVMVVMSYQFVNGLLFTMAGMLAGQRRRARLET
jgi:O-antigen ligase